MEIKFDYFLGGTFYFSIELTLLAQVNEKPEQLDQDPMTEKSNLHISKI
jgi:hypothetical protein